MSSTFRRLFVIDPDPEPDSDYDEDEEEEEEGDEDDEDDEDGEKWYVGGCRPMHSKMQARA